jgi:excisionase family DNA binding protein
MRATVAMSSETDDELMTVKDACKVLAVSHDTIERRVRDGHIQGWKDPVTGAVRIVRKSVMDYLRRGMM